MDNGVLVFIIIALGVVVVWQASKLAQYSRFERMLPPTAPDEKHEGPRGDKAGAATPSMATADLPVSPSTPAPAPGAIEAAKPVDTDFRSRGGDEAHLEEAKTVQQIMARCRYAEFYIEQLDDDYEREEFRRIVDESIRLSAGVRDPMLEATALEPLVLLLDAAGWNERRDALLKRIAEPVVRERVEAQLAATDAA